MNGIVLTGKLSLDSPNQCPGITTYGLPTHNDTITANTVSKAADIHAVLDTHDSLDRGSIHVSVLFHLGVFVRRSGTTIELLLHVF